MAFTDPSVAHSRPILPDIQEPAAGRLTARPR